MHGDQRRKEMEQLINSIKANPGKFLHQETQQTNKTDKAWYLASIFLIGLAVLAVFYMIKQYNPSNNPKSGVEKLKNPSHKNYKKNDNNRSKPLNP
ncbi:flagellar biosynthesis protein FlgG [Helicobacter pylori]|uniref:flagellar biosynthesis protein FlgG n=1 Tax=Helicobacter pylori TaxID=210 RepID=UPI0026A384F2|nr:flagellar biosynthesis protein FlgG [Helicobacter pylori]